MPVQRHTLRFASLLLAFVMIGCAAAHTAVTEENTVERPVIGVALTRDEISAVVHHNRGDLQRCYDVERGQDPNLIGSIRVRWMIAPTGEVSRADVGESTMKSPALEECVSRSIRSWVFPKPKGGGVVSVNFPFHFGL